MVKDHNAHHERDHCQAHSDDGEGQQPSGMGRWRRATGRDLTGSRSISGAGARYVGVWARLRQSVGSARTAR